MNQDASHQNNAKINARKDQRNIHATGNNNHQNVCKPLQVAWKKTSVNKLANNLNSKNATSRTTPVLTAKLEKKDANSPLLSAKLLRLLEDAR